MGWFTKSPQFKNGMNVEAYLDKFFQNRGFTIKRTTPHQERSLCLGDRIFSKDDKTYYVEYKSGIQTAYTNNIFLETVSVDTCNTEGWVYTCQADFLFYATLLNKKILVFKPANLRGKIEKLRRKFKEVKTSSGQNQGYNTWGIIVPLKYAERHLVEKVIKI